MSSARKLLAIIICGTMLAGLFPVQMADAYVTWWDTGWVERKEIIINYSGTDDLTDYQLFMNITYDSDMQPDFADLRFVQDIGAGPKVLDHWIENYVAGSYAKTWIEVAKVSPASTSIYLYYGNISAPNISNGKATFPFFDDFSTDTVPQFNWTQWVNPAGNQHTYQYYLRDEPQDGVMELPGRLIWRMKMSQYKVSNWGTAQWWAIRKGPMDVLPSEDTDILEMGIYANSDVNADDLHPSMMMDAKRDGGTTLSSSRPLVPINLNQYYTYSLSASETKSWAKVQSDDGTILWNPSVDLCPNNTKYWHMGHFIGIYGNFGNSDLAWDMDSHLRVYSKTEHVNSYMEFLVDHIMFTKYSDPEPIVEIRSAERMPDIGIFNSMAYSPAFPTIGENVTITIHLNNPSNTVVPYDLELRIGPKESDWTQLPKYKGVIDSMPIQSERYVPFNWTAVGGHQRAWALLSGEMKGFADIDVNRPPVLNDSTMIPRTATAGMDFECIIKAMDPDGDPLTWSTVAPPFSLADKLNGEAVLKLPAVSATVGIHVVIVKVSDDRGAFDEAELQINFTPAPNRPPVIDITTIGPMNAPSGRAFSCIIKASDPDGDVLSWGSVITPFKIVDKGSGQAELSIAAVDASAGQHIVRIAVSDGKGGTDEKDVIINFIQSPNSLPEFVTTPVTEAKVGKLYVYNASATDADGDILTYTIPGAPTNMGIDPGTGLLRWTPSAAQEGEHTIIVRVSDGKVDVDQVFKLKVLPGLSVEISRPSQGQTITDVLLVSGTFTGPSGSTVEISVDNGTWQKASVDTVGRTWTISIDSRTMTNGSHFVKARAMNSFEVSSERSVSFIVRKGDGGQDIKTSSGSLWWSIILLIVMIAVVGTAIHRYYRER